MIINLPNRFSGIARSAVMRSSTDLDLRIFAAPGTPAIILDQLSVRTMVVTTSRMESTVSASHSISYRETILKVHVVFGRRRFLFPVVTYVDDEYSLARGFLLGFNKRFISRLSADDVFGPPTSNLDLDLRGSLAGDLRDDELPSDARAPFLVYRSYSIDTLKVEGFVELTVENSQATSRRLVLERQHQSVLGHPVHASDAFETAESFVLTGTKPVEG